MALFDKINIVVVNYNNTDFTYEMISSLKKNWNFINEVIVVDNASSNEEKNKLSILSDGKVKVINLEVNIGYFGGLNIGLAELSSKGLYPTLIGNNDLIFNHMFFDSIEAMSLPSNVMVVAPSLITKDGVYQNPAQIKKPSLFRRFFYAVYFSNYALGSCIYNVWQLIGLSSQSKFKKDLNAKPIYIGMGAAYILLPCFFEKNEKLNYPFFLYGEEAFLSKQIEDSNGVLWYEPSVEITHLESVATSKIPSKDKYFLMRKSYQVYKHFFK